MDQDVIRKEINEWADLIESLCKHGVQTEDRYDKVCDIIDMFMRIDKLTEAQKETLETLLSVTDYYQEEHFPYGN